MARTMLSTQHTHVHKNLIVLRPFRAQPPAYGSHTQSADWCQFDYHNRRAQISFKGFRFQVYLPLFLT